VATVYSEFLFLGNIPGGGFEEVSLDPDYLWVMRDVTATLQTNLHNSGFININVNGSNVITWTQMDNTTETWHWEGRLVFPGPPGLSIFCGGTDAELEIAVSGYKLYLP
jgi:hypothetical protein